MRWMQGTGRSLVGVMAVAGGMSMAGEAAATVSSTLVADRYIVQDGGRTYSVLDIYAKGNHVGDVMSSVTGLNGTAAHEVIFATSKATGVTRDATTGKVNGGSVTSDIFVQAGGSSWNPTYGGAEAWDSFIAAGNRKQNAKVTNRAGTLIDFKQSTWATSTTFGGGQMNVANSNYINSGGGSGWLNSLGSSPYNTAGVAENPFARVSLYNSTWNSTYPDLDRTGVLVSKGELMAGAASASAAGSATATSGAGSSLDFCHMIGRFSIDITDQTDPVTMQVQFNLVGRNGTGNETGTIFTGASTSSYRVSQFFAFTRTIPTLPFPQTPTGVQASDGTSTGAITVNWSPSLYATSYEIARTSSGGSSTTLGTTAATTFTDSTAQPGQLYSYGVRASNSSGTSGLSAADTGWRKLSPPLGLTATDGTVGAKVNLAWQVSAGATGYKVLRASPGVPETQIASVATNSHTDASAVPGITYTYAVRASCALGDSDASASDTGYTFADCNGNGIDDAIDIHPVVKLATGNMGPVVGAGTLTTTRAVAALASTPVTITVDAQGDFDSTTEYLAVRLSNPPENQMGEVKAVFGTTGQGCAAGVQRATFTLSAQQFNAILMNKPGTLKIDVTATGAVGGADVDAACQAQSFASVTVDYTGDTGIDCNGNNVPDSCDIASGFAKDCNGNGIPDTCDLSSGRETDLNANGTLDRCEYLVGSPAWPTISGAVTAAPSGTTVPVLPGTYSGVVDFGGKTLNLKSTAGRAATIMRGVGGPALRIVQGGGSVEGFTIQGDGGELVDGVRSGGGVLIRYASPTIRDCTVSGGDVGAAGEGGAVFIDSGEPLFTNCRIESGKAGKGGGVFVRNIYATVLRASLTQCDLVSNTAATGGGLFATGARTQPTLVDVRFTSNQASGAGAAFATADGARPDLRGCRACGNGASPVNGEYSQSGVNYLSDDCNQDGVCDADQISSGALRDIDLDGVPDTCQDCDGDGVPDGYAIARGSVVDCDANGIPDSCELAGSTAGYLPLSFATPVEATNVSIPGAGGTPWAAYSGLSIRYRNVTTYRGQSVDARIVMSNATNGLVWRGHIPNFYAGDGGAEPNGDAGFYYQTRNFGLATIDCAIQFFVGGGTYTTPITLPKFRMMFYDVDGQTGFQTEAVRVWANAADGLFGYQHDSNVAVTESGTNVLFKGNGTDRTGYEPKAAFVLHYRGTSSLTLRLEAERLPSGSVDDPVWNVIDGDLSLSGPNPAGFTPLRFVTGSPLDCNGNGKLDVCDLRDPNLDCDGNGKLDTCDSYPDCNGNGVPDKCDISRGTVPDCNANGVPDGCELASGAVPDCNANAIPDSCDIASGREEDQDGGGVPDSCQYLIGDLSLDGDVNMQDLALLLMFFGTEGPIGDLDGDRFVGTADMALLLLSLGD